MEQLRKQLAAATRREAQLLKAEQDRKDADLSESEKAKKSATEATDKATKLEAQLREQAVKHSSELALDKAGCQDSELAFMALDKSLITYDPDTGKVSGLDKAIKALQATRPVLFGPPRSGGGVGNPGGMPVPGQMTAQQIRSMSSEDFAKMRASIRSGQVKL